MEKRSLLGKLALMLSMASCVSQQHNQTLEKIVDTKRIYMSVGINGPAEEHPINSFSYHHKGKELLIIDMLVEPWHTKGAAPYKYLRVEGYIKERMTNSSHYVVIPIVNQREQMFIVEELKKRYDSFDIRF